jgi:hypothetical protein
MSLTEADLQAIEARLKAATPGPWEAQIPAMMGEFPRAKIKPLKIEGKLYNHPMLKTADAELIANAPQDLALLIAEVRRLQKELEGRK